MAVVFERTKGLRPVSTHYCPGCTHGIIHRLTAEALEELGVLDRAIGVAPVGCSVLAYNYFNCDMQEAAHGRAPAVATGIKRVLPNKFVFTYQGDGDLASIGTAEVVHAAHRGENISIVFVNNAILGGGWTDGAGFGRPAYGDVSSWKFRCAGCGPVRDTGDDSGATFIDMYQ